MARNAAIAVENNFSRGLVTEATALNFPENACTDTFNCVFDEKGAVSRRVGIDFEDDHILVSTSQSFADDSDNVVKEFVWENVAGFGDKVFVVQQFGNVIRVFDTQDDATSNQLLFSVVLDTFKVSGAPDTKSVPCQFSFGNGALFVSHPYCDPFFIKYNFDDNSYNYSNISLNIRDFDGVIDGLLTDNRPSSLSNEHKYNLYNQGWYVDAVVDGASTSNVLTYWDSERTDFPSNCDIWWLYKDSDDEVNADEVDKTYLGNTPAPKGHYLLSAFNQDRSTVSGVSGLDIVSASFYRPSAVAFFSGRVFYSGVNYGSFVSKVYFSQIVDNETQYGKCYQENDPTSENLSDLLPTDGGVIVIPEMGTVRKMINVQNTLVICASNGVWSIAGSSGAGFAANDYSVQKISNISSLSDESFVDVAGYPIWWNSDGIFALIPDQTGVLTVQSLTDQSIKTYYDSIPRESKIYAKGAYNSKTRIIEWVFRSTPASTIADQFKYDTILRFNTITKAFYPWSIPVGDNGPFLCGIVCSRGQGNDGTGSKYLTSTTKYSTIVYNVATTEYTLTFSEPSNTQYVDWYKFDNVGVDFDSWGYSGYKVHGQGSTSFQSNYLTVYMTTDPDSSMFIAAWWDFTNTENSGRVSVAQQCYKHNPEYYILRRKLKIRGQGVALQFKFYSQSGKPFSFIGWSGFETGNTTP